MDIKKNKRVKVVELAKILDVIPEVLLSSPKLDINELLAWRLLK